MRYDRDDLQDLLAAEFVLGNLRGAARGRFVTLMRRHRALQGKVERWEERLFPLMLNVPRAKAPARVWRAIRSRIGPRHHGLVDRLVEGWRGLALAGVALLVAALVYVVVMPLQRTPVTMIAVLNDQRAQPALLVSWSPDRAATRLTVRVLAHPDMPPGTSWQAWILTRGGAPVSAGLIGADETQALSLSDAAADALPRAVAIGVTVESKGGSVTGRPSGPFLFQGTALRVDG
jgi:anti-sigma-K factor RskA